MPVFDFDLPAAAAGLPYTIVDSAGTHITTGTLGGIVDDRVPLQLTITTGEDPYYADAGRIALHEHFIAPGVINEVDSLAAIGGGSATADGVGAVFFGGTDLLAAPDNVEVFCPFIATDDGARAPQRDDLVVIDTEDDTIINVVRSGLYTISINTPIRVTGLVFTDSPQPTEVIGVVQFGVNGESEPPAYDFNNRAWWIITEDNQLVATVALNHTFDQVLLAGDAVRLSFRLQQGGYINEAVGGMEMNPDLTMVMTYRGPIPA